MPVVYLAWSSATLTTMTGRRMRPTAFSMSTGRAGDSVVATTQALGEEGDQPDDQPIEYEWESSGTDDVPFDEPADSDDDDYDAFDAAL